MTQAGAGAGGQHVVMEAFERVVADAARAPADGWDFGWLDGRAMEARPSWHFFDRVAERAPDVATMLEVQAGTGSMVGRLPSLPRLAVATEGFAPSVAIAAPLLRDRGVHLVVTSQTVTALPFRDAAFELVVSRHPIDVWWSEIARVLRPGGTYFAQHVGPSSLRGLSEFFMGPLPGTERRSVEVERAAAERAGLVVKEMRLERTRVEFYDVGAVVYFLRVVPWIVPDFTVTGHRDALRRLHDVIARDGVFRTTSSRTLVEAVKPR